MAGNNWCGLLWWERGENIEFFLIYLRLAIGVLARWCFSMPGTLLLGVLSGASIHNMIRRWWLRKQIYCNPAESEGNFLLSTSLLLHQPMIQTKIYQTHAAWLALVSISIISFSLMSRKTLKKNLMLTHEFPQKFKLYILSRHMNRILKIHILECFIYLIYY